MGSRGLGTHCEVVEEFWLHLTSYTRSLRVIDSNIPSNATAPSVQNAMPAYPRSRPTAKILPVTTGPIDRERHEKEAEAPLTRASSTFVGATFAMLARS